ncbi:hypothetical protein AMJ52_08090 [candidate division TA06 bacterium DG_78]|uniref:Uncharacterized protein n=1 Tax=candidate division TA06 bacterium DG_78 TaxID=1703772 RepID=A0A0S7YAU2_UNCT6|nr:MAG: hypothetical protein AMJ52_08090 [candidate division TA06 bacterium DG_78]
MKKKSKYLLLRLCSVAILLTCRKNTDEEIDLVNISNTRGYSEHPAIAADSRGYFYVVWDEQFITKESLFIYMATRPPAGDWSEPEKIFEPWAAQFPDIEIDKHNTIHLIWRNTDHELWDEVLYTKKTLGGTWTEPEIISIYGISCCSDIAVDDNGNVHIVWQEYLATNEPVFYINKANNGSWSMPTEISKGVTSSRGAPQIDTDPNGNAHMVWEEAKTDTSNDLIVYTTNAGSGTFSQPQYIYRTTGFLQDQIDPSIAVDCQSTIHVVWTQERDIFYTYKIPTSDWETSLRVYATAGISARPYITADLSETLHLLWDEENSTLNYTSKSPDSDWKNPKSYLIDMYGFPSPKSAISTNSIGIVFNGIWKLIQLGRIIPKYFLLRYR